jgi:hypothetical protein
VGSVARGRDERDVVVLLFGVATQRGCGWARGRAPVFVRRTAGECAARPVWVLLSVRRPVGLTKAQPSMGYAPYGKKMEKRYLRLKMILEKFYISYSLCFLNVDVPI